MSRYAVTWHRDAFEDTREIARFLGPGRYGPAAEAAVERLRESPTTHAEAISEALYKLDSPPLRLYFEIRESDRTVCIFAVRLLASAEPSD